MRRIGGEYPSISFSIIKTEILPLTGQLEQQSLQCACVLLIENQHWRMQKRCGAVAEDRPLAGTVKTASPPGSLDTRPDLRLADRLGNRLTVFRFVFIVSSTSNRLANTIKKAISLKSCGATLLMKCAIPVKCLHHGAWQKMDAIYMPLSTCNAVTPVGKSIDIQKVHACR